MARIQKGGLFQIRGLYKSMDWNKRAISLAPVRGHYGTSFIIYGMDHAYFGLISVHGLKINHGFEINHLCEFSGGRSRILDQLISTSDKMIKYAL